MTRNVLIIAVALPVIVAGCQRSNEQTAVPESTPAAASTPAPASSSEPPAALTAVTEWRLVEIQSMDDAQETTKPGDPSLYTMRLSADGSVAMRLNSQGRSSDSALQRRHGDERERQREGGGRQGQ
jgi:hypothetical protein